MDLDDALANCRTSQCQNKISAKSVSVQPNPTTSGRFVPFGI
jgi:hypothetical protein